MFIATTMLSHHLSGYFTQNALHHCHLDDAEWTCIYPSRWETFLNDVSILFCCTSKVEKQVM